MYDTAKWTKRDSLIPSPPHTTDTADGLVREFTERRGSEVEVEKLASHATVRHCDRYALALVGRGQFFSTDRVLVWVATAVARIIVEK